MRTNCGRMLEASLAYPAGLGLWHNSSSETYVMARLLLFSLAMQSMSRF